LLDLPPHTTVKMTFLADLLAGTSRLLVDPPEAVSPPGSQFPQPLTVGQMLQPSDPLGGPLTNLHQFTSTFPVLGELLVLVLAEFLQVSAARSSRLFRSVCIAALSSSISVLPLTLASSGNSRVHSLISSKLTK